MNSNFIPQVLKDKLLNFLTYTKGFFFIFFSLFLFLSLYTFDLKDDSLLTKSSLESSNIFGDVGSYIASFIIYTFGGIGYAYIFLCLIIAIFSFTKKKFNFFFIRILFFSTGLVLLPQIFLYYEIQISYLSGVNFWGHFSNQLFFIHQNKVFSFVFLFTSIFLIVSTTNLHIFFRAPKININKIFKSNISTSKTQSKKEPIIKNYQKETILEKSSQDEMSIQKSNNSNQYLSPSLDILENESAYAKSKPDNESLKENSILLEKVFADFNIEIKVINIKLGPVITLYEILPAAGIKISTIINLSHDISRSMGVGAVRIAQIYGTQYLGVEVPNLNRETVSIKELLSNKNFKSSIHKIPICIGKDISGNIEVIDLSKTPHLLVAGTTGSGKSVFINTLLTSILYKFSPSELRLILIDPKMLELSVYNDIAHLLTPVVTEPKKAIIALKWVCKEMERRYSLMNEENTRSLEGFNQKSHEKLPFIVVFIDEMADLMMTAGKEVEHYVQRLAQMARACGIHLVMATQRPSVDIITGSIKANFPSRISFQVASKYDSRTVLGEIGAEQLLGNGDMLMSKNGLNLVRYQSAFISDDEVNKLITQIKKTQKVQYLEELDEIIKNNDENFDTLSDEDEELISKSIDLIKSTNKASTSFLQRNFQIGYNKAARIMETLEQRGVVSPANHTGKRDILINN